MQSVDQLSQPDDEPDDETSLNDQASQEPNRQEIFEQTFNNLMNGFGEQCEKYDIPCAIALVKHPDFEDPMVFYRAPHIVDAAALMAQVLRQIKSDISADLDTDKRQE